MFEARRSAIAPHHELAPQHAGAGTPLSPYPLVYHLLNVHRGNLNKHRINIEVKSHAQNNLGNRRFLSDNSTLSLGARGGPREGRA